MWNDPVNWSDPSGLIPADTLLDILYISIDIFNIATDDCSRGEHLKSLGLNVIGLMMPYATGLGSAYKATRIHAPCFVEGTLVQTDNGLVPIEEVHVGDRVLSRDEKTGKSGYKEVVTTFETPDQRIIQIRFEDEDGNSEAIGTTANHPFWAKAKGWVGAGELLPGDEVFTSQGGWIKVSGSTWLSKRQTVYNLEVEDYHTYFVGENGAWVHNMCAMKNLDPNSIRFSQDSIKASFRNKKFGTIYDLAEGLKAGRIKPSDIKPIRLVERDGKLISIDNRRLQAYREAGVYIPTRLASPKEIQQAIRQNKFSAGDLGTDTIRIRGE